LLDQRLFVFLQDSPQRNLKVLLPVLSFRENCSTASFLLVALQVLDLIVLLHHFIEINRLVGNGLHLLRKTLFYLQNRVTNLLDELLIQRADFLALVSTETFLKKDLGHCVVLSEVPIMKLEVGVD
jgi:hypothetical protein